MSKKAKIITAVVVLAVVAGVAGFIALRSRGAGVVVDTAVAEQQDLAVVVTASGKVEAGVKRDVYPPAAGVLASVSVRDGQRVKAGQVLARLQVDQLEVQAAQARAGAAQARAQLAQIEAQEPSGSDRAAARASVTAAQASYNAAADALEKVQEAYDEAPEALRSSIEPTLTQARVAKQQAYAGLLQAKAQLAKLSTDTAASRRAAEASLDQANESLAAVNDTIRKSTLRAPIDGVVIFNATGQPALDGSVPKAQAGAAVAPQAAPFSVLVLEDLQFAAEVDEADVDKIRPKMKAEISLDAFPGKTTATTVMRISDTARQTATGGTVFPVYLRLSDVPLRILLGMQGDAAIRVRGVANAVVIPAEALFEENDVNYVFVAENGKLRRSDVVTGATTDTQVQVLEGLMPGDVVAKSGATELTDGMAVQTR